MAWGSEARLRELFGPEVTIFAPQQLPVAVPVGRVPWWSLRVSSTNRAVAALGADRADDFKAEMWEAVRRFDVSDDDTLVLRMDYLEAVIHKPAP